VGPGDVVPANRGPSLHAPGPDAPFIHPGTLMGPRELALLQHRITTQQQPWMDAVAALSDNTPLNYT
jgi:hypothetical protein